MKRALGWAALLLACASCSRAPQTRARELAPGASVAVAPGAETGLRGPTPEVAPAPGVGWTESTATANGAAGTAPDEHGFGPPKAWGNLAVFPVTSRTQEDLGPFTTLDAALAKRTASVHEIGAEGDARAQSAQVNSLVIDNKGPVPIYVLAGTIVKGGKQDRQIGDDFIVGANQSMPVDAYCVEHGRWTTDRDGVATAGQFGVAGLLTDSRVRAAGQYQKDQGEVWSKVAAVNAANKKEAGSGTLMATIDSSDIVARRARLAQGIQEYLEGIKPNVQVVGLAYAVDGNVRSVRWFANHAIFELFRPTLANTAAMDAITAEAGSAVSGRPPAASEVPLPSVVRKFVKDIQDASLKEERSTKAMNFVDVRESASGYGSSTMMKPPSPGPAAKPKAVSSDFTSR